MAATILLVSALPPRMMTPLFTPLRLTAPRTTLRDPVLGPALALVALLALLAVGALGPRDPLRNLLPLTLWTVVWMGLFVVQAVAGDLWARINPFAAMARLIALAVPEPPLPLPGRAGVWPAVALFVLFSLFALADIAPSDPHRLAAAGWLYLSFTAAGMALCGAHRWLRQAEFFTVVFGLVVHLAPLRRHPADNSLALGLPGWAALARRDWHPAHGVMVLAVLGAGSFDGLHETFWWLAQIGINPLAFPGRSAVQGSNAAGLLAAVALLPLVFAAVLRLGLAAVRHRPAPGALLPFALSFLPIAVGYHFAHFLATFLVDIQYLPGALADPLGRGWTGLPGRAWQVTTGFLHTPGTVRAIYLAQAGAVVLSHILAVLMAHAVAARLLDRRRELIVAQAPLAVFMVAYTVFGLWLLAAPRGV